MNPKPNVLFHFTKTFNTLKNILEIGFCPRYSLEDTKWLGSQDVPFIAYPMVCFCNIPLSRIDEHVDFYGSYGIGMKKNWAMDKNLNPVFYISPGNIVADGLQEVMKATMTDHGKPYILSMGHLISFVKPVKGSVVLREKPTEKEFYQESEWRYVPKPNAPIEKFVLKKEQYDDIDCRDNANKILEQNCMLKFKPNDVKYLFVKRDSDIPGLINFINTEMGQYSANDLKILMSRITSLENIKDDL